MISNADQNSDGKVDLNEFIALMLPKMKEELLN
jgi:Ca2+-binding EF-hand superfamily protein